MADPGGASRFTSGQILLAGAVVVAGLLIGSGVLGATFIAQRERDRPRPAVTVTVTPSPTDPRVLHDQNQETTGSQAQAEVEAALNAAAVAQEHHYEEFATYTTNVADLVEQGLQTAPDVTLLRIVATQEKYCIEAQHARQAGFTYSFQSEFGRILPGTCP